MGLSSKQLRLVFAKLRAKGLLRHIKRGRVSPIVSVLPITRRYKSAAILPQEHIAHFISKLPKNHRDMSYARQFITHSTTGMEAAWIGRGGQGKPPAGYYDHTAGAIHINVSPEAYVSSIGYSSRPSHRPRGILFSRSSIIRNAKVGSAKSLYHEYAHSIDGIGKFGYRNDWTHIAVREWFRETRRSPSFRTEVYEGVETIPAREAWAESYSQYASGLIARNRLRKERPLSFSYMKNFFGD